jgi:zinc D-Ala-D-Ala carboxypeptidase
MATYLSSNFTKEEMTSTQVRGVENTPNQEQLDNLERLCKEQLEQCRDLLGPMHVNSGFRSKEVNARVGGAKTSQHCLGLACDFIPLNLELKYAYSLVQQSNIEFDQLIYEYGAWIHVSRAPEGKAPRKQCLMIGKFTNGSYAPYDPAKL